MSNHRKETHCHADAAVEGTLDHRKEKDFFITDLLKSTAKQALTAAAKTGLDVLKNKRSFKDALKTHGGQVIKNTNSHILSQGGEKSRPPAKPKLLARGGPRIKRPLETASGERPPKKKKKKARPLDIFDWEGI